MQRTKKNNMGRRRKEKEEKKGEGGGRKEVREKCHNGCRFLCSDNGLSFFKLINLGKLALYYSNRVLCKVYKNMPLIKYDFPL